MNLAFGPRNDERAAPTTGALPKWCAKTLRTESALLHALIHLADFGIVLLDISGQVSFISEHAQALFEAGAALNLHRARLQCNVNDVRQAFVHALDAQSEAASSRLSIEASVLRVPHVDGQGVTFIKIQKLCRTQNRSAVTCSRWSRCCVEVSA